MTDAVKLGIYVGPGASHSWTWCFDTLERRGLSDIALIESVQDFITMRERLDILVVSGGDTAAIAAGLKAWGTGAIQEFVESGGIYVGICAGACLMLRSSKIDLSDFNFTSCTIANIADQPPQAINLAYKCCIPYKDRFVFQPVYGPVQIRLTEDALAGNRRLVSAPLYGGPAIVASDDVEVLARFERFDHEAIFVVDEVLAERTLLGKAAAVRKRLGDGYVYLLSAHFEHPEYLESNAVLMRWLAEHRPGLRQSTDYAPTGRRNDRASDHRRGSLAGQLSPPELRLMRSAISEARIVAGGIARLPITWLIGKKVWEPEKFELFLLVVWKRLPRFAELVVERGSEEDLSGLCALADVAAGELRTLRGLISDGSESSEQAEATIAVLQDLARSFLRLYCRLLGEVGAGRREPAS